MPALVYLSMLAGLYGVVFNLRAILAFLRLHLARKHVTRSTAKPRRA
jgi:hypothetical protein